MELTREILDQVTKDATFARDIESIIVSVHPEIVLALVAEIERQRTELAQRDAAIAALRYTLEGIRGEAMSMRGAGMDASNMGYSAILITTLAENALSETAAPTAPAPEPAPATIKVGDRVRITADNMYKGLIGRVTGVFPTYMVVETDSGNRRYFNLQEVEPIA